MKDYYFSDEDSEGPWHLKEGRGRVAPEEEEEFFKIEHVKTNMKVGVKQPRQSDIQDNESD